VSGMGLLPVLTACMLAGQSLRRPPACLPWSGCLQLRAIAAFGLQQMIDFFVNASTAVAVPGTSLTGRRR
jgi:hypothetical protein